MELFAIYDGVQHHYDKIFPARSVDRAKYIFEQLANHGTGDVAQFPAEYTLFHIGSFNMMTGLPEALNTPISLGLALEYKVTPIEAVTPPKTMSELRGVQDAFTPKHERDDEAN